MSKIENLHIFAVAAQGDGISGSDRIFIELSRNWCKNFPIQIYLTEEGKRMCDRQKLEFSNQKLGELEKPKKGIYSVILKIPNWINKFFVLSYLYKVLKAVQLGLYLKIENSEKSFIYNASEFWMDSLPCVLLKLRYKKLTWVATWFQTAPNPLKGFSEGNRKVGYRWKAFQYWLAQLPVKPLISAFADKVIVNNEDEKTQFPNHTQNGNTIVMIGAVPLRDILKFISKNGGYLTAKKYHAVFQGRFHPQKGVLELIDIWAMVVLQIPKAKLVMIGDGPLMENVRSKISMLKLNKNIELLGYIFDGNKKYQTFAQSRVVVHPAFYDSGGMASAEAMAFGLPCVGFNLKAYNSYYPRGMVKVPLGDTEKFAAEIISLLENNTYYQKISKEAYDMIQKNWSWELRANQILEKI